jgi:hypothetical protein
MQQTAICLTAMSALCPYRDKVFGPYSENIVPSHLKGEYPGGECQGRGCCHLRRVSGPQPLQHCTGPKWPGASPTCLASLTDRLTDNMHITCRLRLGLGGPVRRPRAL